MTQAQKLQNELDQMMTEFNAAKDENTVICDAPELKRAYTYRKSPAIKAGDVRL